MAFKDFNEHPNNLIGRKVLITGNYGSEIRTIEKIYKQYFTCKETPQDKFNLTDGGLRGAGIWSSTSAKLITDEEATEMAEKLRIGKEKTSMRETIKAALPKLSYIQLLQITKIIQPQ